MGKKVDQRAHYQGWLVPEDLSKVVCMNPRCWQRHVYKDDYDYATAACRETKGFMRDDEKEVPSPKKKWHPSREAIYSQLYFYLFAIFDGREITRVRAMRSRHTCSTAIHNQMNGRRYTWKATTILPLQNKLAGALKTVQSSSDPMKFPDRMCFHRSVLIQL